MCIYASQLLKLKIYINCPVCHLLTFDYNREYFMLYRKINKRLNYLQLSKMK